jgi:hypothetical protein
LGDRFIIHTNGADAQWADARRICQEVLGYGDWFGVIEQNVTEEWPESQLREVTQRIFIETQAPDI